MFFLLPLKFLFFISRFFNKKTHKIHNRYFFSKKKKNLLYTGQSLAVAVGLELSFGGYQNPLI
jgi:hypothetical protein